MELQDKKNKTTKFVTNLAWVFVGFFGYSTVSTLLQSILFFIKPPLELFKKFFTTFTNIGLMEYMPPAWMYILENMYIFASISFAFSLITLTASFAFLKRKNWARIFFAVFMLATMVVSIAGFFFHHHLLLEIPTDKELRTLVEAINRLLNISFTAMVIVIIALHSWLAYKLLSKNIKNEF
ncbi:MAG: hypothetical protein JSV88_02715 [Candidatus Aminicenantes bacterium]|nr:MAG: hypothetical protein JSV88_02715 [Candidatus Aminicenantes bacterium]